MRIAAVVMGLAGVLGAWVLAGGGGAWASTPVTPPPIIAQVPTPDEAVAAPESLALAQDPTSRLTLAVKVNGRGPFDFLVDTGSDVTVISRELAATLALPAGPRVVMHETTGSDDVQTVTIDRLAIGARVVGPIEAPAVPAKDLGAMGMLGVDALRNLHVVMDFKAMRMSSAPSQAEPFDGHTIVVHGYGRFGQLILVNASIRGVRVYVVLDSGSQMSVGNLALLGLLSHRPVKGDPRFTTEIVSVTGRKMAVELEDIAEANVGGIVIHNMPLAFAQLPVFKRFGLTHQPAMLLGMDVLSQCQRVSVDLRRREATFTLN
ncbi:MAG: retroviral-like aspartic protease family protein [Pseudomonadota bacterium]|nr:retroviral-like aspartic protease family protein [Pseudomonadota bacterium]